MLIGGIWYLVKKKTKHKQSNNSWTKIKATLSSYNVGIMTGIGLNLSNNDLQRCLKFPLYYIM